MDDGENRFPYLPIVYFSAEYGLHHSLPFYAGGLGFLAGDDFGGGFSTLDESIIF